VTLILPSAFSVTGKVLFGLTGSTLPPLDAFVAVGVLALPVLLLSAVVAPVGSAVVAAGAVGLAFELSPLPTAS
jgi:hypothetical protein